MKEAQKPMTATKKDREPLIHLSMRAPVSKPVSLLIRIGAFAAAIIFSSLVVWIMFGIDPLTFLSTMFKGAFGVLKLEETKDFESFWSIFTSSYLWATLKNAFKLLLLAVALAPAFKMKFWNIGAEGQLLAGAIAAAYVMVNYKMLPVYVILPLMFIVSIVSGALWGLIPAVFKAKFNTNETLFTLMMNYIVMKIVDFFFNKWRGRKSALGIINLESESGWLRSIWNGEDPAWFRNEDLIFMIVVLIIAVMMYFYLKLTKHGYEISVVGDSQNTAKYAGISVKKVIIRTMALSGAVCGLCGFLLVSAQNHTVFSNLGSGYGFTAIIVAWLSKFNTFTMIGVSMLVVALENGSTQMSNTYNDLGFSVSFGKIIVGVMLLFVIGCEFFLKYKINFRSKKTSREAVEE